MEEEIARLLADTQTTEDARRKHAEAQLRTLYANDAFPTTLCTIASHDSVALNVRQAALLSLKIFVLATWSPQLDEFIGEKLVPDDVKAVLRPALLGLATSDQLDRKVKTAASYVVSKIASVDFPDQWPDLLPTLLQVIRQGSEGQIHGALRVLSELVDDCFNDTQFFAAAQDLVSVIYDVATNESRKATLRALAVSVFKSCFDILEMVLENHKEAVKQFADEALKAWIPFFLNVLKTPLPESPSDEDSEQGKQAAEHFRGLIALKLQVIKALMRIRSVFPAKLSPQSPTIFSSLWAELSALQPAYFRSYIQDDIQGRLEDADGLPYTLDFLVLEELDFMQSCLRAPPVKSELEKQLASQAGSEATWVTEVMQLAVSYAQITVEEEGLWDIDVNIFLSEETNVTANYTPRSACGEFVIKLNEWQSKATTEGLLTHTRSLYSSDQTWKIKEASLYILNQLLVDMQDLQRDIAPELANGFVDFIRYAIQQENEFLRARGYLVAGSLVQSAARALDGVASSFMSANFQAINNDQSEIVRVSCIRALQHYLKSIPTSVTVPLQPEILSALSNYIDSQDWTDLTESDDLLVTLMETLRDVILLNTQICLTGAGLDLLFTMASHGATNFQLTMIVNETFEEITSTISAQGADAYGRLCEKVLPSLTGAFDVGALTEENALTNLATELLSTLAEHGSEPLPNGFASAIMPKLNKVLLESTEEELLKSATRAVKNILIHDHKQLFEWHSDTGKGGLEVVLIIIDRLLGPSVDDNAAEEVGGLAAELVEKAGSERLGPFLMQLLRAVAVRVGSATQAQFIQSLILVFARLSLVSAAEVVDFLSQVEIGSHNGLDVVMSKWLENSVNFAGYDEIRQNVIALSKLYNLSDPRLGQIQVQGDLIVPASDRIMTRSRTRNNPDQYTSVSAVVKILKVLVEELHSASGGMRAVDAAVVSAAAAAGTAVINNKSDNDALSDDDDDGWEDEPGDLDLTAPQTKKELMAYAEAEPGSYGARERDDETQSYLAQFFREAAASNPAFAQDYNALTSLEQEKLTNLS